ncbi:hypothetical protein [uncultured Veillonella sp.]|uniref:hypothetical protein n=1 Tax=uncultured Veillonella sp. TaxID=159268 RepID=UPI0025D2292D|nr:hypothetical protein [uncultured Veillonella sp.]
MSKEFNRRGVDNYQRRNGEAKDNTQQAEYDVNQSYKNRRFSGKKSTTDEYTHERIFYNRKGNRSPGITSNVDHVNPLKRIVNERQGDIDAGVLTHEDIKEAANQDYNLALTNESLNKSKGAKSNAEYLLDEALNGNIESLDTAYNMLRRQAAAEVGTNTSLGLKKSARQIDKLFKNKPGQGVSDNVYFKRMESGVSQSVATGVNSGIIGGTIAGVNNLVLCVAGQKDVDEAAVDVAKTTAVAGASGVTMEASETALLAAAKKLGLHHVDKYIPGVVAMGAMVTGSVLRYVEGEISGEQCMKEMAVTIGSSYIFTFVEGTTLAFLGIATGGLGALVLSSVAITVISSAVAWILDNKNDLHAAELARIDRILEESEQAIQAQRERLAVLKSKQEAEYVRLVQVGFGNVFKGLEYNDVEQIAYGLDTLASHVDGTVPFKTRQEFNTFFDDKNSVFEL